MMVKKKNSFRDIGVTVFIAGAVLMGLEIIGGRLLAPYYGNSVYVWGSIISIFLIALSMGYYIGGYLADKYPTKKYLSKLIFLNVLTILPIPFIYRPIVEFFTFLPFILQPLVTSFILFLIPSIIIGTVSPYAIKLTVKDLDTVGQVSGSLYSISTIGSVVGTLVTTFIFTLFFSINTSLYILSLLLLGLFFYIRNFNVALIITSIFLLILVIQPFMNFNEEYERTYFSNSTEYLKRVPFDNLTKPLFEEFNSPYGLITVEDRDGVRGVSHNRGDMGAVNINNPLEEVKHWEYLTGIEVAFAYNPELDNALTIGLASGTLQRNLMYRYGMVVDAVDINPTMVEVTDRYFGMGDHIPGFRSYVEDGRVHIQNSNEKYDLIIVDVAKYDENNIYVIPFHLVTKEFYELTKERMNEEGVFVKNVPMGTRDMDFLKSVVKTMKEVYAQVNVYEYADCCKTIVATDITETPLNVNYLDIINTRMDLEYREGIVYTDAYAPTIDVRKVFVSN